MSDQANLAAWQLEQLRSALDLIAAEAQRQAHYLEELGTSPSLDKLALEFDDARRLVPGLVRRGIVPPEVERIVADIDSRLQEMTRDRELWSREALDRSPWQSLRPAPEEGLKHLRESTGDC
jgi:hypothetical protein